MMNRLQTLLSNSTCAATSRREAAERRLAQELDAAKADVEERDQSIADMCSTWERTVGQLRVRPGVNKWRAFW